jgi:arylsulfatase
MIMDDRYKLIWYPNGNIVQIFDLLQDPNELTDIANDPKILNHRKHLEKSLIDRLYGEDLNFVRNFELVGTPATIQSLSSANGLGLSDERDLLAQRGVHYPAPPLKNWK